MIKSIIHDFKFNFAKPIDGELSIWTKISKGTIFGKTILLKCITENGNESMMFIEIEKGKELLKNKDAVIAFLKNNINYKIEYFQVVEKGRFYFNGNLVSITRDVQ